MSEKSYTNELERVLARPDIDRLRLIVPVYHDWSVRNWGKETDEWPDELDIWFNASHDDHDLALALVVLAAASYDEPEFLGLVAAGLLEELLWEDRKATDELVQRILSEARRTPRFRWMLSGVWTMSARPDIADAVKKIVGDLTTEAPLPPRPWA